MPSPYWAERRFFLLLALGCTVAFHLSPEFPGSRLKSTLRANPVNEIVDALDKMLGVAELSETDLKDARSTSDETFLNKRQEARAQQAPSEDALERPSVAIFFAILGLTPLLAFFLSVQSGLVHPFGL